MIDYKKKYIKTIRLNSFRPLCSTAIGLRAISRIKTNHPIMNVILYKRVSTDEQADLGFSLQHQETMLIKYCEINKYNIVDIYTEDY